MPVSEVHRDAKSAALAKQSSVPKRIEINASGFETTHVHRKSSPKREKLSGFQKDLHYYENPYTQYFLNPRIRNPRPPILNNQYLRENAKFTGQQQSGSSRYAIKVELKTVDLMSSVVTGFFQISGLTDEHPLITTCFKGEIINNPLQRSEWTESPQHAHKKYSFITEENNWSSFPKNDLEHWKKLTGCPNSYTEMELRERLRLIQSGKQDPSYIYMRWKEEFLVPDSRVKHLTGASFEGFYYIVLNIGNGPEDHQNSVSSRIRPGSMSGLYFYTQSEKFQSLSLEYVEERGSPTFDFA